MFVTVFSFSQILQDVVLTPQSSLTTQHFETVKMSMGGPPSCFIHIFCITSTERNILCWSKDFDICLSAPCSPSTRSTSHRNLWYVVMVELLPASRAANVLSNGLWGLTDRPCPASPPPELQAWRSQSESITATGWISAETPHYLLGGTPISSNWFDKCWSIHRMRDEVRDREKVWNSVRFDHNRHNTVSSGKPQLLIQLCQLYYPELLWNSFVLSYCFS